MYQVLLKHKAIILHRISEGVFVVSMGIHVPAIEHLKCFKQIHLHCISFNKQDRQP